MDGYIRSWFGRFERLTPRCPDPWLAVPAGALLVLGLLMALDTTYFLGEAKTGDGFHYFRLHLVHIAAGLAIGLVLSQLSLVGLRRLVMPLGLIAIALLIMIWIPGLGVVRGGARRWVRLGPVLAEPSELVKFALVFFLAALLERRQERMTTFAEGALPAFAIVTPLALMTLRQPDFGATVMIALILFAMLFAAGARLKHLALAGGGALAVLAILVVVKPYRLRRLAGFMDPWRTAQDAGFQLMQSFMALGAGGIWGQGLGGGRQKMFYLPAAHTDFVFAVVTEDLGLIGAAAVLALFTMILIRGMRIAHDEPDGFASLLTIGLTVLLTLQALINMAVVIGLVPTKGLPLPFLSYGGTSTVMTLAALGALLALSRRPAVR
ncbi:MAG TPA: putative lipid II flippase FtsW [Candidatus Binataceae bacterium]|nr:putative lipid II flippase FtsW [Candidatus Binataceae bacterium]